MEVFSFSENSDQQLHENSELMFHEKSDPVYDSYGSEEEKTFTLACVDFCNREPMNVEYEKVSAEVILSPDPDNTTLMNNKQGLVDKDSISFSCFFEAQT
jgi:hypothetical protein